ncbi:spidroin-1-like [Mya arenaria]|uniref:spidroin-1-like n=1 Tax=Mya arenaria TaxID=6604 RepID=UPI0022E90CF2|nr:spidroin-1-like [Mya arenaria]
MASVKMEVDKVDMSLDDIIKLNRKEQRANRGQGRGGGARGRGRGRPGTGRGAGGQPQSGRGFSRGGYRGRGASRGRGSSRGATRGGANIRGRGPNRYQQLQLSSPVQKLKLQQQTAKQITRGRSRGLGTRGGFRGRGNLRGQVVTRGRGGARGRGVRGAKSGIRGQGQSSQGVVGFTSLNRQRQQAMNVLLKAKKTLANLDSRQQQQKGRRSLVLNQQRGLQISTSNLSPRGRGRGKGGYGSTLSLTTVGLKTRGRGSRGRLNVQAGRQFGSTVSLNSTGTPRGGRGRGRGRGRGQGRVLTRVITNSALTGGAQGGKRRRWRVPNTQTDDSGILTVSVANSPPPQPKNRLPRYEVNDTDPSLQAQIRNLKPATSTKYVFKKAMFAQATTTSLNERFSESPAGSQQANPSTDTLGRKVFF